MTSNSPPYYVLVSLSSLSNSTSGSSSSGLSHPTIQYFYADDSPLSLLPQHPDEHVLVLDYDPSSPSTSTAHSISEALVVNGLKIEEAPGAAATDETNPKNDRMFIIETTNDDRPMNASHGDRKSTQTVLAQFKRRNGILRRALEYPDHVQPSSALSLTSPRTA